ncbi:hypothetical protein GCM10025872_15050 [Barrientosiimonas endolithica]|uniref:Uroporphyrinogen decarboxylase (URO-D) domain-containing protein n=1 Tax=Barrientosiimonas endolithica TaxID=1535208 RepID=A0ABM8HA89_9MICO|nr:hypothetical protein GCM10025872_15050 [Barrientosiimonas endolithica]
MTTAPVPQTLTLPTPGDPADSVLVRAARGQQVERTPVWFMRQAGRSLPEYREVRADVPMLQACRTPDLVTEITLQPVRRHGVDAAIFFSDIVVPLQAVGVDLDIVAGVGPVVAEPIRTRADLDRLPELTPEHVTDIAESVRRLVSALGGTPLIGFAGAPFTLASYLVEGGPSRNHEKTKALMAGDPQLWHDLCARLAQISGSSCASRSRRGPRRCSCSTRGRARCRWTTTPARCSSTPRKPLPPLQTRACPASTSASAPASCSGRWPTPGAR